MEAYGWKSQQALVTFNFRNKPRLYFPAFFEIICDFRNVHWGYFFLISFSVTVTEITPKICGTI